MTNTFGGHRRQRIVLAYSGDFETSIAIPWLAETHGAEVVALTLDFGHCRDLEEIRDRALTLGAVRAHVLDVREEFAKHVLLHALKADALCIDGRRLAAPLAHAVVAGKLVEIADIEQSTIVAHGGLASAGRIAAAVQSVRPAVTVLAPARDWGMSQPDLSAYAAERHLRLPVSGKDGASVARRAGTPVVEPGGEAAVVEIAFDAGTPVAVNGVAMPLLDLIGSLDFLAGKNGVGRFERFETPAASVLCAAHGALQQMVATDDSNRFSRTVSSHYADLVDNGAWFTVLRAALDAYVDKIQERVHGAVRVRLFQGACEIVQSQIRDWRQENDDDTVVGPLRHRA